jgi:hypothetical protein
MFDYERLICEVILVMENDEQTERERDVYRKIGLIYAL